MYFNVCNKYRKFKKYKMFYISLKRLSPSIVYSKCDHEYKKIFREESTEILIILALVIIQKSIRKYIIMPEENMNQNMI